MLRRNKPAVGAVMVVALLVTGAVASEPVVLSSGDDGIVVRYEPGRFSSTTLPLGETEYSVLRVEGAEPLGRPGAPDVPVVRMTLAVPDCRNVSLSVSTSGSVTERGPRVVPALSTGSPSEDGLSVFEYVEGDEYSARGLWPPAAAAVTNPTWLSRQKIVHLELFPCQVDPETGTVLRHGAVDVTLSFEGVRDTAPSRATNGRWERLYRAVLDNYETGRQWRARPEGRRGRPDDYFDTSANWLKLSIAETGMHAVGYDEFVAAGVDPTSVDPASIRVFAGPGTSMPSNIDEPRPDWMDECTIDVQDGGDGTFDQGDRAAFYATSVDAWSDQLDLEDPPTLFHENRFANEAYYWLTWESSGTPFTGPPARMGEDDLQDDPSPLMVSDYRARAHFEDNRTEFQGRGDNFYMYEMKEREPEHREYYVRLTRVVTDSMGLLRARLEGNSYNPLVVPDHVVYGYLNEAEAFLGEWEGTGRLTLESVPVPFRDYLPDEPGSDYNEVDFFVPRADSLHEGDRILLDWYELEYWRELWADLDTGDEEPNDDQVIFGSSGRTGVLEYSLDGFETDDVRVYKVGDRHTLWTVPGVTTAATADGYGATFQDDVADTASYVAVSEGGYIVPGVVRDTPSGLRTDTELDYVIIVYDDFYDAAVRLRDYRRSADGGGYNAKLVRVSDVYDEFSWGLVDPTAIRDYLKYLSVEAAVPPTHVVLVGDASSDYRHYLSGGVECFLPTWYTGGAHYWPTDVWFVGFESGSGYEPGMAFGRLSARSSAEMATMVEKIIHYESDSVQGVWKNTAVLIGDDEYRENYGDPGALLEYVHTQQAEQISTEVLPWCIDRHKIYLMEYEFESTHRQKPAARAAVLEAWKQGSLVMNYTGHGNEYLMAHELIFIVDDIPKLHNYDRLPLFFAASCRLNKFDMDDSDSVGELLVKSPVGGSVASIGSTRDSGAGYNSALNRAFLKHCFGDQRVSPASVMDFGQAFQTAFIETGADNYVWPNNTKFSLIGDPATTFVSPDGAGVLDGAGLEPLRRRDTVSLDGSNADATENMSGVALVRVTDSADTSGYVQPFTQYPVRYSLPGEVVYEGTSAVSGGDFSTEFVVSALAEEGPYGRIRAYFYDGENDGSMSLEEVAIVDSVAVSDATGPDISLAFEGGVTTVLPGDELEVRIYDDHGVNLVNREPGDGIILELSGTERDSVDMTADFVYDMGSSREGAAVYELPSLGLGGYSVSVSARDNMGNRSTGNLSFDVASSADFEIKNVVNHPNPFRGDGTEGTTIMFELPVSATVTIDVFTVGGRRIRRIGEFAVDAGPGEIAWNGLDQEGDELANGVYLYRIYAVSEEYRGDKAEVIGRAVIMR